MINTEQLHLIRKEVEVELQGLLKSLTAQVGPVHFSGQRGAGHHKATLSDEEVLAIRCARDAGESCQTLAARYSLDPTSISNITIGKTWKHVGGPLQRSVRRMPTVEEKLRAFRLRESGMTVPEIAESLSRSQSVVYAWFKKADQPSPLGIRKS